MTWPSDSDATSTANAHNNTIDKAKNLLEQGATDDEIASRLPGHEPTTDDEAFTQPAEASSTPPANRWIQRLSTPIAGWVATVITTLIATLVRLPELGNARTPVFGETYYVKDAWPLLALGYEGTWAKDIDTTFANGDTSRLSAVDNYPVHPPTDEQLIAMGIKSFGQAGPVGWRITVTICGIITVFPLCRLAQDLSRLSAIILLAGLFLATDGMATVMNRASILGGFPAMFALTVFPYVVKDQHMAQPKLSAKLTTWGKLGESRQGRHSAQAHLILRDRRPLITDPSAGNRPRPFTAGIYAGLACSIKWPGIYVLAFLGLLVALREITCRQRTRHLTPICRAFLADVWQASVPMAPITVLIYVASWFGWFTHSTAHGHGRSGVAGFAGQLADLWLYRKKMWTLHSELSMPHKYQSSPLTQPIQARTTSFYRDNGEAIMGCQSDKCMSNAVALDNPLL